MFKSIFTLIITLFLSVDLPAIQSHLIPAPQPKTLSTSVLVPCAASHFRLIPDLLRHYNEQTILPDEVVVSLSECHKISPLEIESTEKFPWNFRLKIVKSSNKLSAGQNRNVAFANSTGDLILTQDADDIPHPQRVEIVKYLFENFKLDHLLHLWIPSNKNFTKYQAKRVKSCYYHEYPPAHLINFHNACACMLRHVCESIKWPEHFLRTEDTEFNLSVYSEPSIKYKSLVWAEFIRYRVELSTA